mmetsp:Transcript_106679/g.318911  ORF Transcript_106679/g.318911 Transcript_106679/m.318911 type:complete len:315 (-) Transcript_106679:479-1423(-)
MLSVVLPLAHAASLDAHSATSCAANVSLTESRRRPESSTSPRRSSSSRRRSRPLPIRPAAVASARTPKSTSGMSAKTSALYSGLASIRRHALFTARVTRRLLALEMFKAWAAKRSSRVALQSMPSVMPLTSMRLNFTTLISLPSVMAWPRRITFRLSMALKSTGREPVTRMNSSCARPSQAASSPSASLQPAQTSAAARTAPSSLTAAYSRRLMPLPMASAFACLRHSFQSVEQSSSEGFRSILPNLYFTIPSSSSSDSPASSFRLRSRRLQASLSRPAWAQRLNMSPSTSRAASFLSSSVRLVLSAWLLPLFI